MTKMLNLTQENLQDDDDENAEEKITQVEED